MLQWNDFHPYNALHVVRVPERLELERLKEVVSTTLETLALSEARLDNPKNPRTLMRYGPVLPSGIDQRGTRNTPGSEISVVKSTAPAALYSHIQREINTAFLCGSQINPFRFFTQSLDDSFYFGLTYFHPIADAESIVLLLKLCVETYRAGDTASSLEMYPRSGSLLLRHPVTAIRRLLGIPKTAAAMRRCFRPPVRNHNDFNSGFAFFHVPPGKLGKMQSTAKQWDVTLNDLLLAILMKCVSPLASGRAQSRKRKQIGLGCIVNLRKELGFDSRTVFGLFLGSFVVTHDTPDSATLESIARDVRRQTRKIKQSRIPLSTPVELAFGRLLFSCFSTERKKKLYQKNYPLWGGITNMNVNSIWPQTDAATKIDYFRAVSTGPATPLVLSATTAGNHLNLGLTFRTTVFSDADIQQVKGTFLNCVEQMA